jgi:outer membrane protein
MMNLATRIAASLVFILFTTANLYAQAQQISLEEAISLALENSISIQQAQNNLVRNEADVRRAYGAFMPNLNASSNANRSTGQQFNQSILALDSFTQNSINASLNTNMPIFTGWQNISNLRAARIDRDASQNDFERLREDIIFETASEFLQIILNEELLLISRENLETTRKQLEQVEAQVEVGMRPIVDLYNQEAVVANNELQVIQRENSLNISKVRLVRILQLDPLADYDFVAPGIDEQNLIPQQFELVELIEAALASRRDLRSLQMRLEASEHALRAARSGFFPTLSIGASVNTNYSDSYRGVDVENGIPVRVPRSFPDQFFDERISRSVGLSLSIPIFDRFQTRTNVTNRQIDLKNARLGIQNQQSAIFQEIRQAYNDYISITQELITTQKALIAAEKAFETQQERYNVGSTTLIELTAANNEFINAASNRVQAIYRFVFQEKLLDYYLGRISENISF